MIFRRDGGNNMASLTWLRAGAAARIARRVRTENRQDASFANGEVRLAGTMISPATRGRHPTIILVHGSGVEDREYVLPLAHFLVRRGIALFGYDKRGVGASSGEWRTATFEDLAGDVAAAFRYLKTRGDVDTTQIGLFGVSQAGWIMPLAAARAEGLAFLISISGPGIPPWETTIDETRNELTARGMKPQTVDDIINLMKLQYYFARTGNGWDAYTTARERLVTRIGRAPETFPGTPDAAYWNEIRRTYFYDPAPALRELRVPTLAVFGELDDNIVAAKNAAAWKSGLQAAGNEDYTLVVVPRANHLMLEAKVGNNAEMPSLQRFAPSYSTTVEDWLAKHVRTQGAASRTDTLDLTTFGTDRRWKISGRAASVVQVQGKHALEISEGPGMGVVWLDGYRFSNGVIDIDLLGRSRPSGGSFLGVAFRVVDGQTHDAVYFRPFNFRAADSAQHSHAVQYVSHPRWTWNVLRSEHPGQYEAGIVPEPDGDQWFHVRVVVQRPKVGVYVNGAAKPSLVVNDLSDRASGSVGVWVGEGSGGRFATLLVTPTR